MKVALAALRAAIGVDELLLAGGLALITFALWPALGRGALLAPGLVLTWIAIPTRAAGLVVRPPTEPTKTKQRE